MEMGETLQQELLQMGKQRSNGLFCLSVQMIVKQSLVSTNFFDGRRLYFSTTALSAPYCYSHVDKLKLN
ncbi:hypothetical protein A0V43_15130 [Geobacillus sp. JS12]|nr:hypothetical protein GT50_09270 [Geobacillus stearothermophilus 10]AMQ21989.1 hypothetical protein A0V43_15130 [Geobacillus sp. JS12]